MELALLVYIVETLTYNSSIMWNISLLIVIGLLLSFAFQYWVQSGNRPAITVGYIGTGGTGSGDCFVLSEDYLNLKAGVQYTVSTSYSDGDIRLEGISPASSSYYKRSELRKRMLKEPMTLPAVNKQVNVRWKLATTVACVLTVLHVTLPSKSTAYYMAGAYMVQKVLASSDAKEIGSLAVDATKAQLRVWATKSPELANLMVQSGLNEIKQAANQAAMDKL